MGGFTYYLGSDKNCYAKCIENATSSTFTYSDGTPCSTSSAGSTKYFKVEPIKWCVLTSSYNGKKLLLAENILTANIQYYGSTSCRGLSYDGHLIYPNNYKYSNIRAYLNGIENQYITDGGFVTSADIDWSDKGFLQSAFTSSAQSLIATTTVDNSAESTIDATSAMEQASAYACADTSDKIFLLSEKEVTTRSYGFATYDSSGLGSTRIRVSTDYAKANRADQYRNRFCGGHWWLRSPYCYNDGESLYVDYSGRADYGEGVYSVIWGVVPALCLE